MVAAGGIEVCPVVTAHSAAAPPVRIPCAFVSRAACCGVRHRGSSPACTVREMYSGKSSLALVRGRAGRTPARARRCGCVPF